MILLSPQNKDSPKSKPSGPKREGWLVKKEGFIASPKNYWFQVEEMTEYVSYYLRPPEEGILKARLRGTFNLEDALIKRKDFDKKVGLEIKTKNGRKFQLIMANMQERDEWERVFTRTRDFAESSQKILDEIKKEESLKDFGTFMSVLTPHSFCNNH